MRRLRGDKLLMYENQSKQLLFSHMEYIGDDFAADSQAIADHPETRVKIKKHSSFELQTVFIFNFSEMVENHGRIPSTNFLGRFTAI